MTDCEGPHGGRCKMCGMAMPESGARRNCAAFMHSAAPQILITRIAFGSILERMLTAIGITKERVQEWTRTKDCGCAARQRWLDQWGYAQQEKLERLLNKAARFYFGGNGPAGGDAPPA